MSLNFKMDRLKLDIKFNPALLRSDLQKLTAVAWTEHFVSQNYEGDWSVIPLRGPKGANHPIQMIYSDPTATEFTDTPFLELSPYFQKVLETFQCELKAVRLMKLSAGSIIKEHTDHDLAAELGTARLHIPIVTNADVNFQLNGSQVFMEEGECWYLRLSDRHSVVNNGCEDRIHLVIDAETNDWLLELLGR